MYKYGKDFVGQVFCNKLLCFTVDIYAEKRN